MSVKLDNVVWGVYEVVRLKLVEEGHYPDVTSVQDLAQLNVDIQSLRDQGNSIIRLVGDNHATTAPAKKEGTIYISFVDTKTSRLGLEEKHKFEEVKVGDSVDHYRKYKTESALYDVVFNVRYVTYNAVQARRIEHLLLECLGVRKTLEAIDENGQSLNEAFPLFRGARIDVGGTDFFERGYRYEARYVNLEGLTLLSDNVPVASDIGFDVDPEGQLNE